MFWQWGVTNGCEKEFLKPEVFTCSSYKVWENHSALNFMSTQSASNKPQNNGNKLKQVRT
jgi:hypothetical protein